MPRKSSEKQIYLELPFDDGWDQNHAATTPDTLLGSKQRVLNQSIIIIVSIKNSFDPYFYI